MIKANAEATRANADQQRVQIERLRASAEAELNRARAAHEWAIVRYMEDLRVILRKEYEEIERQQAKMLRLISQIEWNQALVERIRMGRTDASAFRGMMALMAGAAEFEPIRESFTRKVDLLPKDNFISNDDETGTATPLMDFPGGDVRKLLLFVRKNNFSFEPLGDAHWLVMDSLASIVREAVNRILRAEQQVQAARAARIAEVFITPK